MIEKSWEHQSKAFFTFIDLKKAYDSVPREVMWLALNKLGVPESLAELIISFHEDTKAKVKLNNPKATAHVAVRLSVLVIVKY